MAEINIDPSVLQERSDTYSSLTDMNGANVFTNAYEQKVQEFEQTKGEQYKAVQNEVFVSTSRNSENAYDQIKADLFIQNQTQIVKEVSAETDTGYGIAIPIIGIVCVAVGILLFRYVDKKRRIREDHEADRYIYE